jgi:hypothetical protein
MLSQALTIKVLKVISEKKLLLNATLLHKDSGFLTLLDEGYIKFEHTDDISYAVITQKGLKLLRNEPSEYCD